MTKAIAPQLRFNNFNGDWTENLLGNLLIIRSAVRVHKDEWTDHGVPFFRSSDVVSYSKKVENKKAFISHELFEDLSAKSGKIGLHDLLVTGGGSIGIPYLVPNDEPLYFKDADLLWFKKSAKIHSYFLYTYLATRVFRRHLASVTHIGTIAHYTIEQAKSTPIIIPTLPEQEKIADFLTAVDKRIEQLMQKKALLKDYKKGMMQRLFTQAIRFKDDQGNDFPDWEEQEFALIAEKRKSKYNPCTSDKEWQCIELESLSQGTGKLLETFSSFEQKSIKNSFVFGEVLFGKLRPYLRKFLHADFDGVCSSEIWVLRGKTVTNSYLYQLIQTHKFNQAANVSSGSKMPRSDWEYISSVPFSHPTSSTEQTKIANFLSAIDQKVDTVASQITETQNFKRGLLQQMFV